MAERKIKRALISVYDKTGIAEFARALHEEFGIEILSTGGTAALLEDSGIPVTRVETVTGCGEMLDGRVKTLHPKIHAAILADRDNPDHMSQLADAGIEPIDMVVVTLYPFEQTIAKPDCTFDEAIEMIDIGGPCLLRAAAKNHKHVFVVSDPCWYPWARHALRTWDRGETRKAALRCGGENAFVQTTSYDGEIASWLSRDDESCSPDFRQILLRGRKGLRYGENPHQVSAVFQRSGDSRQGILSTSEADEDSGKEMSFNNFLDSDAALRLCEELTRELPLHRVGPAFQPVSSQYRVGPAFQPVSFQRHTERHLPHIQDPGATYFVTFRLKTGSLSQAERSIVLAACRHWHRKKMTLHACAVMPDHVHLIATPHETAPGEWVALGKLLQSIKGFSAKQINKKRGTRGPLWLDESWDRIIRNEKEYSERWEYIENNPGLAGLGDDYPWVWLNHRAWEDLAEADRLESRSHTEDRSHTDSRSDTEQHHTEQDEPSEKTIRSVTGQSPKVCVFIKHSNACGCGVAENPIEAYRKAYLGDPNAAMGGILAVNFDVDAPVAEAVMDSLQRWGKSAGAGAFFVEVWLAPFFDENAINVIRARKEWGANVRLLNAVQPTLPLDSTEWDLKRIVGGVLMQTCDPVGLNEEQWKVVTQRQPTSREMDDLRLAWLVCKHTKSNAISLVRDGQLIGNGAGQMSRIMSCRIATWLARENGHIRRDEATERRSDEERNRAATVRERSEGSDKVTKGRGAEGIVAASDAFFPFRDGPDILIDAGVTAIIQPGGSKRDTETIATCNERGVAMVFTQTRHFRH